MFTLISEKQHQANIRNAKRSTGPKTKEGKEAVRFNALKHGLRAEATLLPTESAEQFNELCTELEDHWSPQNVTERLLVEQMAVHQWHLRRLATGERRIFVAGSYMGEISRLERFAALRTRLENSFAKTIKDLVQLQKMRPAAAAAPKPKAPKIHPPAPEPPPTGSTSPGYAYVMQPQTP